MKTFIQFLNEMPLPKGMEPDALVPKKSGEYDRGSAEGSLKDFGSLAGKGSSRVAYRVWVEQEQFKGGTGKLDVKNGYVDTVIKLALNNNGLLQNEEEIKFFRKFKNNSLLLPIIDDSNKHRISVILNKGSAKKTVSNWIQMPYAEHISFRDFDDKFKETFGKNFKSGDLWDTHDVVLKNLNNYISNNRDNLSEKQLSKLNELISLFSAGFEGDIHNDNCGLYKGNLVFLDYGYTTKTHTVYHGDKTSVATVDEDGNIILKVT